MNKVDIYFEPNYGCLYEKLENGKCEVFRYASELGAVYHMFIKRETPTRIDKSIWYDLVTPYGYGGPIISECKENNKNQLISEFGQSFYKYCINNNIVSEFVRFHPIVGNAKDFKSIYNVSYVRNTVGTKINKNEDPIKTEFSKSARKSIRRALEAGLTYKIIESPNSIHDFKEIYYSTMDRNEVLEFYYFDDDYFSQCLKSFRKNTILIEVLYKNKPIAAALYFAYGKTIHAHLSGTLTEYLNLSPSYLIKYATVLWGKEHGIELIHYGGGTNNRKDNPLYQFKKKFGKNTEFEFYIGKKIWNVDVYNQLCIMNKKSNGTEFFPAYRG